MFNQVKTSLLNQIATDRTWLFTCFALRCLVLSVYVLRFMTLGSKINSKFTNTSGLLTEQVSKLFKSVRVKNNKDGKF